MLSKARPSGRQRVQASRRSRTRMWPPAPRSARPQAASPATSSTATTTATGGTTAAGTATAAGGMVTRTDRQGSCLDHLRPVLVPVFLQVFHERRTPCADVGVVSCDRARLLVDVARG